MQRPLTIPGRDRALMPIKMVGLLDLMAWDGRNRTPAERRLGFRPPGTQEGERVQSRQLWLSNARDHVVLKDFYRVNVAELAQLLRHVSRRLAECREFNRWQ